MKTNHLLASAAFTAVLFVMLPAHAQLLGGGAHGRVTGTQAATLGGGTSDRGAVGRADVSDSARAGGRVAGVGRVNRTVKAGAQATGRNVQSAKADTAVAARQSAAAGGTAVGTARAAAAGTAAAGSATAAGQEQAQARHLDTAGAVAGGLSFTEEPHPKAETGSSKPSASQPARTSKPGSPSTPRHSSPSGNSGETPRSAGLQGETNADASASVTASTTR